ncbi:MAG: amino acid ABC transporter substrate-binding protein [Desulfobacteraceae bacterium]|uniref:Amino acid ABC transporter substrate-binding protein n=1 Tax=Candidatus Desulfaltia bathyphila TaxID=2841697 RepID=A0A8J6N8K2_9BACT|nr:amino acid ABC transporter substrate-binding protein [Candidatus Desulfaltia bathyphila]
MKKCYLTTGIIFLVLFGFLLTTNALAVDKVVIGHPACLSGKYAKAGEQAIGGIKACIDWVNNVYGGVLIDGKRIPVKYKYYDSESKKEGVTSLIERLITVDKVNVVFSSYSSGLTLAGAPVAERYNMLYMDHGGASDRIFQQGFQYIVQTIGPGSKYHVGTLNMFNHFDPKARRVALAYEDSEFARMTMRGAEEHATKLGYKIVFKRTYPKGVTDLTPLLSDLKANKPDIVIGGGHYEDGQLFARQMSDLDINVKGLSLVASATLPAYYKALGGRTAEGVMGPSHWEYGVTYSAEGAKKVGLDWIGPDQDEFVSRFKKALGKDMIPDYHAAEAGAQVLAYVKAAENINSLAPDKVRAALGKLKFMSFYGGWDVDDTGMQIGHSMVDMQWQNGKRFIVWPLEAATGKLVYPKPKF